MSIVPDPGFTTDTPLGVARDWVIEQAFNGGAKCPCCGQKAQAYNRKVNRKMAISLIRMASYQERTGEPWLHMPTVVGRDSSEEARLRYWGLIEERPTSREDGGHAGYWRVTGIGSNFVRGLYDIPRWARVYDGQLLELHGPPTSIEECLGKGFNLRELLRESA